MPYVPVEVDRRRKVPKETKKVWVRVRVSEKEREKLKRAAEARGVSMSELIRSIVDGGVDEKST